MATYTEIQENKIIDVLNVGHLSRATSQEVKFLNEQNVYWGTLVGNLSGNGAASVSAVADQKIAEASVLYNLNLENAILALSTDIAAKYDLELQNAKDALLSCSEKLAEVEQKLDAILSAQ